MKSVQKPMATINSNEPNLAVVAKIWNRETSFLIEKKLSAISSQHKQKEVNSLA